MSRLPSSPQGQSIKPDPDIYTVLLLVAAIMLIWAGVSVFMCLSGDYGLSLGQIFTGSELPK